MASPVFLISYPGSMSLEKADAVQDSCVNPDGIGVGVSWEKASESG
jgi:hypothetical protein